MEPQIKHHRKPHSRSSNIKLFREEEDKVEIEVEHKNGVDCINIDTIYRGSIDENVTNAVRRACKIRKEAYNVGDRIKGFEALVEELNGRFEMSDDKDCFIKEGRMYTAYDWMDKTHASND